MSFGLAPPTSLSPAPAWRRLTPWLVACGLALVSAQAPAQSRSEPSTTAPLVKGLPDFTALVDAVGPAVVNIRTVGRNSSSNSRDRRRGGEGEPELDDETREFLRRHFGIPLPDGRSAPDEDTDPRRSNPGGVGSGFIISADGYLLTNAHVVENAQEVLVKLTDQREFKATVVGADKRSDVAVLKIEADKLPTVRFGDSTRLRVGEWVIAIGSPFDLDNTVTAGIVSAKARDTGELLPLIQTDVAINPGNSGGPLINLRGEVVGINSQIYSRSGGYQGIAFAIPAAEVQRIAGQLRTSGRVVRGRIGVRIGEVSKEVAEALGLPKAQGALVSATEPDSPGEKAGIEPGDIITRFDGQPIAKATDLPRLVVNTQPGSSHTLQLLRKGATKDISVVVAESEPERPPVAQARSARESNAQAADGRAARLGLKLSELSDEQRRTLKVKAGVRVEAAAGVAARAGLKEGDILLTVGQQDVLNLRQLEVLLSHQDLTKPLGVLVRRGDAAQYLVIRTER